MDQKPESEPSSSAPTPGEPAAEGKSTFELQDIPAPTRAPRVGPPKVIIGASDEEPVPPKWPDLLAIVCMIFGTAGMLVHFLKLVGLLMAVFGLWEKLNRPEKDEQSWYVLYPNILFALAGFIFAGMLLTGGLALYRRWPWFTGWLNTWAMIKIPWVLLVTFYTWAFLIMPVYHMVAGHEVKDSWGHYWTAGRVVWSFIWLAWQMALPAFILLWLRKKHVQDTIESWA